MRNQKFDHGLIIASAYEQQPYETFFDNQTFYYQIQKAKIN